MGTAKQSVFYVFIYARTVKQKVWSEAENGERDFSPAFLSPGLACSWLRDSRAHWIENVRHENETGENFSRAFYFRVFPTIWASGTGYTRFDYSSPLSSQGGPRERQKSSLSPHVHGLGVCGSRSSRE